MSPQLSRSVNHVHDIPYVACVLTILKNLEKQRNGGNWLSNPDPWPLTAIPSTIPAPVRLLDYKQLSVTYYVGTLVEDST